MGLKIIDSARKHGVSDADIIYVIEHAIEVIELEDEPQKLLYIGFDRSLRALEVVTVVKINGEEIVIHAMKATKKVIDILKKLQRADWSEGGPDEHD
ncbi:hypothetical protein LQZ19_18480 [Treponema primitia]|uniref:hypothetical protein n=1 Tax=Treponema primitia TaxID=88058 RepID=UPI00397EC153